VSFSQAGDSPVGSGGATAFSFAYAAQARGEIRLSPELAEYKLLRPDEVKCWPQGTGQAMATWLRQRGIEPQWLDLASTD
jgi:hypothetical protein